MQLRHVLLNRLDQLPALVRDWRIPMSEDDQALLDEDPRRVLEGVYNRLRDGRKVRYVFETLSSSTKDFLRLLAILGGEAPTPFLLQKNFAGNRAIFEEIVREAIESHLAFIAVGDGVYGDPLPEGILHHERAFLGIPDPFLRHIDLPPHLPESFAVILRGMTARDREALADAIGLPPRNRASVEGIWELYQKFVENLPTVDQVEALSPLAREILSMLTERPRVSEELLVAHFQHNPPRKGHLDGPVSEDDVYAAVDELLSARCCFALPTERLFSRHDLVVPFEWRSIANLDTLMRLPLTDEPYKTRSQHPSTPSRSLPANYFEAHIEPFAVDQPFSAADLVDEPPAWVFRPPVSCSEHLRYAERLRSVYELVRREFADGQDQGRLT